MCFFYRSQLSVCSEPAMPANIPVYQLSIDQSLTEEVPKVPQSPIAVNTTQKSAVKMSETSEACDGHQKIVQIKRPTTLELDSKRGCTVVPSTSQMKPTMESSTGQEIATIQAQHLKTLFRSNSSSLHKRQSTFVPAATTSANNKFKLSSELDQIFVISSNRSNNIDEDNYDSIEVIDERRMKNMPKSDRARLYKSNTFICEEYYTDEQSASMMACVMNADSKETVIEEKHE